MSTCKEFKPFQYDTDTCDTCGDPAASHPAPKREYSPYREAIWKTLIKHGGVPSYYGGYDDAKTIELRAHLGLDVSKDIEEWSNSFRDRLEYGECEIDFALTEDPRTQSINEFAGTFASEDYRVEVVQGLMWCKCGEYRYREVAIRDKTLGHLIWLTVKEGEIDGK